MNGKEALGLTDLAIIHEVSLTDRFHCIHTLTQR